jgi:hypothetical protein
MELTLNQQLIAGVIAAGSTTAPAASPKALRSMRRGTTGPNIRNVTQSVNGVCPVYAACSPTNGDDSSSETSGDAEASSSPTPDATSNGTGGPAAAQAAGGSPAANGGGGRVASSQSGGGSTASFGAMAGVLGLAVVRVVRNRRRVSRRRA